MAADLVSAITTALAPFGLNLVGAASVDAYDRRVPPALAMARGRPGTRSIVVVGSGGGDFWRAFRRRCAEEPATEEGEHPLDAFTVEAVESGLAPIFAREKGAAAIVYPFRSGGAPISFMDLAVAAGLGAPSLLGVLVHPRFGPWMALRAAIVLDREVVASRPADGFDPCTTCPTRPCMAACPGAVVRFPGGWDVWGCVEHRRVTGDCSVGCGARIACVLGPEERYPDDEMAYHHRRAWAVMKDAKRPG